MQCGPMLTLAIKKNRERDTNHKPSNIKSIRH